MTLTVRLDSTLDAALQRYCTDHGVSKSLAVQESLAVYLVTRSTPAAAPGGAAAGAAASISANYQAFANAGLLGAVALDAGSADKAAVRERVVARSAARSAAGSAARPAARSGGRGAGLAGTPASP